ncbi:MAG: PKD domain-containing protein [Bacteroidota bacterium]|nr:PKD domain-containing protein [Bacteroidota bacterium]
MKSKYHIKLPKPRIGFIITALFYFISNFCYEAKATHIVGGQLNYRTLGNGFVEITLVVRRDCKNGRLDVPFDDPALIGVFDHNNQKAFRIGIDGILRLKRLTNDTIQEIVPEICVSAGQEVCVHQAFYRDTFFFIDTENFYTLSYQRCCRNVSLQNIRVPLNIGMTLDIKISGRELRQQYFNPIFNDFPDLYFCVNKPIVIDHAARGFTGDSLVYRLCTPWEGRDSIDPYGEPTKPPYTLVTWKSPFSLSNLLGLPGPDALTIDPVTGLLTANPHLVGQFLVGVCVDAYSNLGTTGAKKLRSSTRRDFQINVVPCGISPTSLFSKTSTLCEGLTQQFADSSLNALRQIWYFDFLNDTTFTSQQNDPKVTFPRPGTYEVVLVTYNEGCTDTSRMTITVADPQLKPDFSLTYDCIQGIKISLKNLSTSTDSIIKYEWVLEGSGNNLSSTLKDPMFSVSNEGPIRIKLKITDINGCMDSIIKLDTIKIFNINLVGNDTTICSGDTIRLVRNPIGNLNYTWDPITGLDLTDPSNPLAFPKQTTTYRVTITDGNCELVREIKINVKQSVSLEIDGDSFSCNGNVSLRALTDSGIVVVWSTNPNFNPILFTGINFSSTINSNTTFYVRAGDSTQCIAQTSFEVKYLAVQLDYAKELTICARDTFTINVRNLDPSDTLQILWERNPIIISPLNVLSPTIYIPSAGRYVIRFFVTNQFFCTFADSIVINAVEPPNTDFEIDYECGSLTVKVSTAGNRNVTWDFGDGKGMSTDPVTTYTYDKSGVYKITLTIDSVCIVGSTKEITIVFIDVNLADTISACHGEPVPLNPGGNPDYEYRWTPITGLDNPNAANPIATVTITTTYFVEVKDSHFPGCSKKDSVTVRVPPELGLIVSQDTFLCGPAKIKLRASTLLSATLVWCDENGNTIGRGQEIELDITTSRFLILKATDSFGCITRDTVRVNFYELLAEIEGDDLICLGDTTMLFVIAPPGVTYTYDWTPKDKIIGNSTGDKITVAPGEGTTYTVVINNGLGCIWTLTKTVQVNNPSFGLTATADPTEIVPGVKVQLLTVNDPDYRYNWGPDDGTISDRTIYNPTAMPAVTTTYTVTVTDEAGCTASASVTVTVVACPDVVGIPNAFSPNGDGKNETFHPLSAFLTEVKDFMIYNRWGEQIFLGNSVDSEWDGTYKGEKLGPDVFGYYIRFRCFDNVEYVRQGNVSLLK